MELKNFNQQKLISGQWSQINFLEMCYISGMVIGPIFVCNYCEVKGLRTKFQLTVNCSNCYIAL